TLSDGHPSHTGWLPAGLLCPASHWTYQIRRNARKRASGYERSCGEPCATLSRREHRCGLDYCAPQGTDCRKSKADVLRTAWRSRPRAADRLRERREPSTGARLVARTRDGHPCGSWRRSIADCQTTDDRIGAPCSHRRSAWADAGVLAGRRLSSVEPAGDPPTRGDPDRQSSAAVHFFNCRTHRVVIWVGPRTARIKNRSRKHVA